MTRHLCRLALLFLLTASCLMGAACSEDPVVESDVPDTWEEIVTQARGTTVRFYMYGGWAPVNSWIDSYVARELKDRYDITLERVPMEAPVFVNKLVTEHAANLETGSIDLLWINGENFKNAMEAEVLWGPFTERLPNFQDFVDPDSVSTDFGYPVNGHECPYGQAQFVFEYDSATLSQPPSDTQELKAWIMDHPGRFTYPQPPDFTGSAFIRQLFYALTGGHEQYMGEFDQELFDRNAPTLWAFLNELKPYLWEQGQSYPRDSAAMDTLFARGELDMNMSYHPIHAQSKILEGSYPESVRTFILDDGSIFNVHFTAIPFNAPNRVGAMVVANFLLSPQAQLSKLDPANWGDFPALDFTRLPDDTRRAMETMDLGLATLSAAELATNPVPEIPSAWLEALERGWETHVLRAE